MTEEQKQEEAQQRELGREAKAVILDLFLQKGLYSSIKVDDSIGQEAERQIRQADVGTFDCYCTTCDQVTPFIISAIRVANSGGGLRNNNALLYLPSILGVRSVCQRDLTAYSYAFQKVGDRLIKIGQFPSMADISFGELKEIDKGLESLDRKELGKALGLFAHDAASGAFVYLRRVFERMIKRAHERLAERGGLIKDFDMKRMDEKIEALKGELPERVVKNRRVFSVLSQGIHELSDEQCKAMFPLVKAVIFQILEQEEHKRRKKIGEQETDAALQALLAAAVGIAVDNEPVPGDI